MERKNIRTKSSTIATFIAIVSFALLFTTSAFGQNKYIRKHQSIADSLSAIYGIPSAVILGVAVIESGNGTSRNSKLLNNHFGIVGKNNLQDTHGINSAYKYYNSVRGSFEAFCKLLTRKYFYKKLKGNPESEDWLMAISKAGYSSHPQTWRNRILKAIQTYGLDDN